MLERMKESYETGIYAQGYRIIESINNIGYLLSIILLPVFAHYLSKQRDIKEALLPALNVIYVIIIGVVGVFYFQSEDIIGVLYHSEIAYSSRVFSWLILNFIPIGLLYVLGTLLTANENFRVMLPTLVVAVILNIVLNYFLINTSGAVGAAQATLITQLFMLLVYAVFTVYRFKIKFNLITGIKFTVFTALSYGWMQLLLEKFESGIFINILWRSGIYLTGIIIMSFILQIIDRKALIIK
jgi:O-antigen/teichoic acid export membrane protein